MERNESELPSRWELGFLDTLVSSSEEDLLRAPMGGGKSHAFVNALVALSELEILDEGDHAHARVKSAVEDLRLASTAQERRCAVQRFLAALAELIACLLRFLGRLLILLLSRLLGRAAADEIPLWTPEPIDASPQITPRGPNLAFLVYTHRGGFRRSALGSAVLAA
ncbi:hypothetical protein ACH4S9_06235 [Streptomyces sp. NPDC021225]|uniref:hypothetical protein n=1 Tax=Streptomyces sp. NPDC021225 TaxID=3365121 RepID=UPI00378C9577